MEAFEGAPVEYTSDGEISEQMSATVTNSLRKLGKRKINVSVYFYIIYSLYDHLNFELPLQLF